MNVNKWDEDLDTLITRANNIHQIIKFTWEISIQKTKKISKKKIQLFQPQTCLGSKGLKHRTIQKQFHKAENIPRIKLLEYKDKTKHKETSCVIMNHLSLINSFGVIHEHWKTVEKKATLSKIFPEPPIIAFSQPKSLRNLQVGVEASYNGSTSGECCTWGTKRCKCCLQMHHAWTFHSKAKKIK